MNRILLVAASSARPRRAASRTLSRARRASRTRRWPATTRFADYKALVCVFLFGGNDSWNMVVPSSDAEYAVYAGSRQNLAVPQGVVAAAAACVPDPSGWSFGLHPAMPGLAELFNVGPRGDRRERRAAASRPTTLAQYPSRSVPLPPQLFSHNDQQDQWHSLKGNAVSKSGWAGRIADVLAGPRAATSSSR